ncbi:MAG: ATP-binding protein [Sterolibacteriaceae bacterium MAG5]|nr:ATP-binding protein [Candidatus Nitricoxidireducens bremensis]
MKLLSGIRVRVLVAALLPAVLVALSLAGILLERQYRGLEEALQARARAEARQLAGAAEFGVFAGSREALLALARGAQAGDGDIRAVSILDARGELLAATGASVLLSLPAVAGEEQIFDSGSVLVVSTPIKRPHIPVDDVYSGIEQPPTSGQIDGAVVIEMSRERLEEERARQMGIGAVVTLAGLLLAGWLALRIARGVTRPILHISDVVQRIGEGDLAARVVPDPSGAMPGLEEGINAMALRIGYTQEFLLQQIDAATAELRERKEEAESANAAKSRFLAAASHDLRQPLHALGLFVSRLLQLPHDRETKTLIGHVDHSVAALQDLLDTLLDISRLDAGMVTPKPTDFPLDDLFARLAMEHDGPAREKLLAFRVRKCPVWLHTDPRLLERILMNFLGNAMRYTPRGGILMGCRRRGDRVLIQVWDTGVGIPAEHLQHVFSEYVQLDNPERNRAKGLGLGLAICDRLSQLLGLPLGVRSRPGKGSVFWIEVPLGQARESDRPEPADPLAGNLLAGTVALVEDDPLAAAGMVELLTGWGCHVFAAATSTEAVRRFDEEGLNPDLAICDFRLQGGEDGISAGIALRRRFGQIPILLISGDADEKLVAGAARRGFTLLAKPVRPGKLRAMLQHLLTQGGGQQ